MIKSIDKKNIQCAFLVIVFVLLLSVAIVMYEYYLKMESLKPKVVREDDKKYYEAIFGSGTTTVSVSDKDKIGNAFRNEAKTMLK